jgi:hypothetical protein
MGQLGNMICDNSCDRFLHDFDVVGLVHTGVFEGMAADLSISTAHACLYARNRPLSPQSGGHAIFVKKRLYKHASVVLDKIETGVVWIKVQCPQNNRKAVFIGFVYLPPQASNYYTQIHSQPFDAHMSSLQKDIMFFQESGQVILMGDFNARTGRLNEWDLLDPHERRLLEYHKVTDRKSRDLCVNSLGRRIISMCENTGTYIMNGRSQADINGSFTFQQINGKGRSVIDYAIVSRDLIDLSNHEMINFTVVPLHQCPNRSNGGRYDHSPIMLRLSWQGVKGHSRPSESHVEAEMKLRWRPEYKDLYTDIVQTDGIVLSHLTHARHVNTSVQEACEALGSAVLRAAEVLHSRVGGVFVSGRNADAPKKDKWLSREALEIRKKLKASERRLPSTINVVNELRKMYRKQVKADRRVFLKQSRDRIRHNMVSDVKKFWAKFKKGRTVGSAHSVSNWSDYFGKLFNEDKKEWVDLDSFERHCLLHEDLFGMPTEQAKQEAACLNRQIQTWEVDKALSAMKLGKAVGYDKIPAEFFRQAYHEVRYIGDDDKPRIVREYLITPYLTEVFQKILSNKHYPTDWAIGVITPVPKPKGDLLQMDNYRGITVGSAISKIFAQVLLARMDNWAETYGLRASTQFGFRKDRGTVDAVFMLRHLVDKAHEGGKPLHAAFIDFRKAYDSVPRDLLWRCMQKIGIHGEIFDILQQMYNNVRLQVKVDNCYGTEFESLVGVKQGDPLSPLLFGLYIDRFAQFLKSRCPDGDLFIQDQMIQVILYADDLVMLTHDPKMLQTYLDTLDKFCQATGMSVNVAKSEVMTFFKKKDMKHIWTFNRKTIKESKEFIYLGVVFSADGFKSSVKKTIKRRATKAKNSLFGIMGTCHGMKVFDTEVLNRLMDGAVVPSALYGSEIWGPDLVNSLKEDMTHQPLEEIQWLFLRMALWVGKATPHNIMLKETKRELMILRAIENSIGFWNRMCSINSSDIIAITMKENIFGIESGWSTNFCRMLQKIGAENLDWPMINNMNPIDRKGVMKALKDKLSGMNQRRCENIVNLTAEASGSKVRACPDITREGFKAYKYHQWFEDMNDDTPYISQVQDIGDIRTLAKFRCGMHWLATEAMRSNDIGRSRRICACCHSGDREDEMHVLFCDAYDNLKRLFPVVFDSEVFRSLKYAYLNNDDNLDDYMKKFMNCRENNFAYALVGFLRKSIKIREGLLNTNA